MEETRNIPIQKKLRLLKTGIFGFIGCLVLSFFSIVLQVVITLWQMILGAGNAGSWLMTLGLSVLPVFFFGAFVFFGVIIAAAVKEPRHVDLGEHLRPHAGAIASYLIAGVLVNVVPLLVTLAALFCVLYRGGRGVIFLALSYFAVSIMVFIAAVGIALVRGAHASAGTAAEEPAMKRLLAALRPEALSGRSRRVLTRLERVLGSALGIVLYLLFTARDLYEKARGVTGHGTDSGWPALLATTETMLAFFSLFIFIFSTLFLIKSIKTMFDAPDADASAPPVPGA